MAEFDFIENTSFRASLERDYGELQAALQAGIFKGALVLAGSIVETVLIDHIASNNLPIKDNKSPQRLSLREAIELCKADGMLTDSQAQTCSVINDFRNLIHPGRMQRLNEQAPRQSTARVAAGIVDMVLEEFAAQSFARGGATAEQLLSKLLADRKHIGQLLPALIGELKPRQLARLLKEVLPAAHAEALLMEDIDLARILETANRVGRRRATSDLNAELAKQFISVIKHGGSAEVDQYIGRLFNVADLDDMAEADKALAKSFLLRLLGTRRTAEIIVAIDGIEHFLEIDELPDLIDPLVKLYRSNRASDSEKNTIRQYFLDLPVFLAKDRKIAVRDRLGFWEQNGEGPYKLRVIELIDLFEHTEE